MASSTPDPSSSELLTDFDIADVETWDDQNDNSKEVGLVTMSNNFAGDPRGLSSSVSLPLKTMCKTTGLSTSPSLSSKEQLGKVSSPLQASVSVSGGTFLSQHSSQKFALNNAFESSSQPSLQNFHDPVQSSGHALATLRALAQAQEEQARLIKEQERARQEAHARLLKEQELIKQQEVLRQEALKASVRNPIKEIIEQNNSINDQDLFTPSSPEIISISPSPESQSSISSVANRQSSNKTISSPSQNFQNQSANVSNQYSSQTGVSNNTKSIESQITVPNIVSDHNSPVEAVSKKETSSIPMATLQLPIGDKKDGKSGKSVLQLKGQLVRTHDQKLMLVTEVGGKKVGYLISPQSGQLQSAVAAQLISKHAQASEQVQLSAVKSTSKSSSTENTSPKTNNSPDASATQVINVNEQVCSSQEYINRSQTSRLEPGNGLQSMSTKSIGDIAPIQRDDESSMTAATVSVKKTHVQIAIADGKTKKKRRGKGKKKKDSNEPAKPISPYLMFFKDVQPIVRQQNPSAGLGEVSKLVSQRWEKTSDEDKKIYNDRSSKAKEEYQIKLAEYRASLPAESDNTPVGTPSEQPGTSTKPIILDSTETDDKSMDCSEVDATDNDVKDEQFKSSNDSPVYNYVTNDRTESVKTDTTMEDITENKPGMYDTTVMDMDEDLSTSEDLPSSGKKSRQKTSKKSKSRDKTPTDDVKQNKLTKFDSSPREEDEEIQLIKSKSKKSKKKHKSLTIESLKSPPKLTMKINIKDSKITESPTKSPIFEENLRRQSSEENDESSHVENDRKPSTQPKALQSFKIPLKRPSSPTDGKGSNDTAVKRDSKTSTQRKCAQDGCDNPAKTTRERGPMYCSNQCLVNHCRNAFQSWVLERKSEAPNS